MDTATPYGEQSLLSPRARFEPLEPRVFLHGSVAELLELGVPKSAIRDDGHIGYEDFLRLSPEQQRHIDPHLVEGSLDPVDFDAILGIPSNLSGRGGPEVDALPDWFPAVNGSITLDQTSQVGRTLVKFPTAINNQGAGPGIGISGRPGIDPIPTGAPITSWLNADGSQAVLQPIYSFNGNSFSLSHYRAAGSFTYHTGHGHFHFDGYNNYRLRQNVGGVPGDYVSRPDGTRVVGEKIGFCLINVLSSFTMENGQSSTTLPGYNAPGQPNTGCGMIQGVHVGEADQYGSGTTGQWLDVTGVPNGQYFLEITVDGENVMLESNETNNTKNFPFTLNVNPPPGGITRDEYDTGGNNDTLETATDMNVMGTFVKTGLTIHWGQDHDWFRFVASSSGNASVSMTQANGNVDLYLYDAGGAQIGAATNPSTSANFTESITHNFVQGQTYYVKAQTYNSLLSSNYQIAWNLKPLATSASQVGVAMEGETAGKFRIARNGPLEQPLTVHFTLGGTAQNGVDYETVGGSVTMGNLDTFADIDIVPIDDRLVEGRETITLTITSNNAYAIGQTGTTIVLVDNDIEPGTIKQNQLASRPGDTRQGLFGERRIPGDTDADDDALDTLVA